MDAIQYDGIIALLLFLVGVPVLVLQFMSQEIRNVLEVEKKIFSEVSIYLAISFGIISLAILKSKENSTPIVWMTMFALLFFVVTFSAATVLSRYGFRENTIRRLTKKIILKNGRLNNTDLQDLIEIGMQSSAGTNRGMVINALRFIVEETCTDPRYRGDSLENLITGIVHILTTSPTAEDLQNFETASDILTTILSSNAIERNDKQYIDQFHAVNALSALGQTMLAHTGFSAEADYIMMDFEEALGLVVMLHPELLPDVTQALLVMGSVALRNNRYLFAVAAMERMLTLVEANQPVSPKSQAEMLGLTAHFWTEKGSSRLFIESRLERISSLVSPSLQMAIGQACQSFQMTMRFDTADQLLIMRNELKYKKRRKKNP